MLLRLFYLDSLLQILHLLMQLPGEMDTAHKHPFHPLVDMYHVGTDDMFRRLGRNTNQEHIPLQYE